MVLVLDSWRWECLRFWTAGGERVNKATFVQEESGFIKRVALLNDLHFSTSHIPDSATETRSLLAMRYSLHVFVKLNKLERFLC